MRRPGSSTSRPTKTTSPRPPMRLCATFSEPHARASWPLPDPTLAYFPNARFASSDRDQGAGVVSSSRKRSSAVVVMSGHIPVLLDRCVELLRPALARGSPDGSGAVLVDATLGAGGHAERFLTEFAGLKVIGLDRDPDALWTAGERLAPFADRVIMVKARFDAIAGVLAESGYWAGESVDAVLFDLGVSSMQLDRPERGFSYSTDAPLDMRMDPEATLTAADIVNTYDEDALTDILTRF